MLIKNMDEVLANGTMGNVVRFVGPNVEGGALELGDATGNGRQERKKKRNLAEKSIEYPIVEFTVRGGKREVLVLPHMWKMELPSGEVQASREQVGYN